MQVKIGGPEQAPGPHPFLIPSFHTLVAQKAANDKKERIIAEVWEEIRRKRDMALSEPPRESKAKRMKCNVTAVLSELLRNKFRLQLFELWKKKTYLGQKRYV